MISCLERSDLQEIGDSIAADFERRVAGIPKDLCAPFHVEGRQLETQLLTIYQMVARLTRRVDDLSKVAELWGCVVAMSDVFGQKLGELAKQHPHCGAESYYDRVLDLRNKCLRLQKMHE